MTIDYNTENSAFLFIDIQEKLVAMLKEKIRETIKDIKKDRQKKKIEKENALKMQY